MTKCILKIFSSLSSNRENKTRWKKDGYYNSKEVKIPTEIVILPVFNTIFVHKETFFCEKIVYLHFKFVALNNPIACNAFQIDVE